MKIQRIHILKENEENSYKFDIYVYIYLNHFLFSFIYVECVIQQTCSIGLEMK